MSASFLIAAAQGSVNPVSGKTYADQVQSVLQTLFEKSGLQARRVQELHWFAANEDYWFTAVAQSLQFAPDLAHFHWPAVPLLAHATLQSVSRALEAGERDLVLLGQQSGDQAVVLLLASPTVVGRSNLSPRAQVATRAAISRRPDGFFQAAARAMTQAEHDPDEVNFIASTVPLPPAELKASFPAAKALPAASDLFLLERLTSALEEAYQNQGVLLSAGPHGSGLVTWVERP